VGIDVDTIDTICIQGLANNAQVGYNRVEMRTDDDIIADTFQPLLPWVFGRLFGPWWGKLFALGMSRPGKRMVERLVRTFGSLDVVTVAALRSSSYRRKQRRKLKRQWLPALKAEAQRPQFSAACSFLKEVENDLCQQGCHLEINRVLKLANLEADYEAKTEDLSKQLVDQPELLSGELSPTQVLDSRDVRSVLRVEGGIRNYYHDLASLIVVVREQPCNLKLSEAHRSNLAHSFIKKALDLDINELKKLEAEKQGSDLRVFLDRILQMLNKPTKMIKITRILMRYLLNEGLFGAKGAHGLRKVDSLERPKGENLTLADTIADTRAEDALCEREARAQIELELKDLPAAQRRDVEITRVAERKGIKTSKSVQRNFQRALKTLRQKSKQQQ